MTKETKEAKAAKAAKAAKRTEETKETKEIKTANKPQKFNLEDAIKSLTEMIKKLIEKFKALPKNQKIICAAVAGVIVLSIASVISQKQSNDWMCERVDSLDSARFFGCDNVVKRLEEEETAARRKEEEKEKARVACESQPSDDGMKYSYHSSDGSCEKYETEKSCELKNLKLWSSKCVTQSEYNQKKAEYDAKQTAEKQAKSDCSAKGYDWNYTYDRCNSDAEQQKQNNNDSSSSSNAPTETPKQESSNNQPSAPSAPAAPSIDTIANTCWSYGKEKGVSLTDYASTDINKDGDYYQIVMWHQDRSLWKCWYNPTNKDVFVEKIYN